MAGEHVEHDGATMRPWFCCCGCRRQDDHGACVHCGRAEGEENELRDLRSAQAVLRAIVWDTEEDVKAYRIVGGYLRRRVIEIRTERERRMNR